MLSATPTPNPKPTTTRERLRPRPAPAAVLALTSDPETRDLLLELAVADGFGLRCTATPDEAGRVLELERPGLVLVDLDLPARLGNRFLRDLRQGPFRDIPCVAVTATNDPMLAVSCDAPIFFKPDLDGIEAAVARLFWPESGPRR